MPFISICIPAYRHPGFVQRLLYSIQEQEYRDFEVIVSDDSPDNLVEAVCRNFEGKFPLKYVHNPVALGSPANWNNAIRMATGKWIKLIHADDWLASPSALQKFADAALNNPGDCFFFSGYEKFEGNTRLESHTPGRKEEIVLQKSPLNLVANNFIGHPSVTLLPNRKQEGYNEKLKWMVDIEYYLRELKSLKPVAIPEVLMHIGVHPGQVTQQSIRKPRIEIPEHLYLLQILEPAILSNIRVYDHYWRLFRNLRFKKLKDAENFAGEYPIPDKLKKMWAFESHFPLWLLKYGPVSKGLMAISYTFNR